MGWPDCDVTYPVPKGRIQAIEGEKGVCPVCHAPRVRVHPFRQRPYELCVNPACPTNREPDVIVGECAACKAAGRHGDLVAHKSERTGKRFIRCTNYDECGTSYPLPQRGELHATGEVCPDCGAPIVEVVTQRGPWRLCVNMDCPGKQKKAEAKGRGSASKASAKAGTKAAGAKSGAKSGTKSTAKRKTTAKSTTRKTASKSTTKRATKASAKDAE
jgi:DNA topoisomerase-1